MRKKIYLILSLVFTVISVSAQFHSETDVLYYLDNKTFESPSVGATLTFSEMGTQLMVNGNYLLYEPDIQIVSPFIAYVTYRGVKDPSVKAGMKIYSSKDMIVDRGNNRAYFLENRRTRSSYSQEDQSQERIKPQSTIKHKKISKKVSRRMSQVQNQGYPQAQVSTSTGYHACQEGPFTMGCYNVTYIPKVQNCLGLRADGYFGPSMQKALENIGFSNGFTSNDLETICNRCSH